MNKQNPGDTGQGSGPRTVADCLGAATRQLAAALGLDTREARLEARVLAAHAWRVTPAWLIAHDTDVPDEADAGHFDALLARRLAGEPVAYLTGSREFFGRPFEVSADVLIPRPDTELLVELALERIPPDRPVEVLDLGTGSGCIAITLALERPHARVTAVDRSGAALEVAQRNANLLGARVEFIQSDWFSSLGERRFNLIVSNPPYIMDDDPHLSRGDVRFEPLTALASGPDGLADLRHLVQAARRHLQPSGSLLLEHGYNQAETVRKWVNEAGLQQPQSWNDLAGIARVSGGILSE